MEPDGIASPSRCRPIRKAGCVIIQFDGAYMNATVWLNGKSLGTHPYGYTPFWFDVTEEVSFAATNLLAVKISNEGKTAGGIPVRAFTAMCG